MGQTRKIVLIAALTGWLLKSAAGGHRPKFYPDDPIQAMPAPMPVGTIAHQEIHPIADFLSSSRNTAAAPVPAGATNTLGEVPDSEWFTNRHGRVRLSRHDLQHGPPGESPTPPFEVTGGKVDGIMPGFRMRDSKGRRYFVKGDPVDLPELATGAEAIVSRLIYAIGYNAPKNDVVEIKASDLRLSPKARISLPGGKSREMTWSDIEEFQRKVHKRPDGSIRIVASLSIEGEGVGPFRYDGTRPDDPNDTTPHENRRDLRGLYVVSAWLNHTDAKADNTFDTVVEEDGSRFIRHYLIDFGSALGSDGDKPKDPRLGHEYMLATPTEAAKRIFALGLTPKEWERLEYPKLRGVGHFEASSFEPDRWTSDYPNAAFLHRLPDDDYWAAKQVMAFTDDDIRAIVETARYSDPISTNYIVSTLVERRNKIGHTFFSKILPLDHFRVENGQLMFDDLAVQYGFHPPRHYWIEWSRFNNLDQTHEPITGGGSTQLPVEILNAPSGSYFSAAISSTGGHLKPASIYLRKESSGYKIVGIDRAW